MLQTLDCELLFKAGSLTFYLHYFLNTKYFPVTTHYIPFVTYSGSGQDARSVWPTEQREHWDRRALVSKRLSSSELPREISSKTLLKEFYP